MTTLKISGTFQQPQKDFYCLRLRVAGGNITLDQLATIQEVAERYGDGYIHLTTRQGVEIPFVHFNDIEDARQELEEGGISLASGGSTVRGVSSCQGSAVCRYGLIDAKLLSAQIDRQFVGSPVPGKFKIAVTGCLRSCAKPQANDLGFEGTAARRSDRDSCATRGVKVWAGGRIGRNPKLGEVVINFLPLDKIPRVIETSLQFRRGHGKEKERFSKTLDRVGLEIYRHELNQALNVGTI